MDFGIPERTIDPSVHHNAATTATCYRKHRYKRILWRFLLFACDLVHTAQT